MNTLKNSLISSDKFDVRVGAILTLYIAVYPYPPGRDYKVVFPADVVETIEVLYKSYTEGGSSRWLCSYTFNKPGSYEILVTHQSPMYGHKNDYAGETKKVIVNVV